MATGIVSLLFLIGTIFWGLWEYFHSPITKKTKLKERENAILEEMRDALEKNNTVRVSNLERELARVRSLISSIDGK